MCQSRSNWTMLCIFLKILAGCKGIKSPLITADALFWWGMCLSLLGTPGTPRGEGRWGGNSGEAARAEEPNQISFPGGDFNLNDRKTWNTLMSRSLGASAMPGKGIEPFFLFSKAVSELLSLKFKPQLVFELLQLLWMQHDKEKALGSSTFSKWPFCDRLYKCSALSFKEGKQLKDSLEP